MKSDKQQAIAAAAFAKRWKGRGYEKGDSQVFWTELLTEVFGILIEQKSIDKDLRKGIVQSDGSLLNPFQQAKRYVANMPLSEHPKWIVTCNFAEFLVYDMEQPNGEPEQILLANLGKEYYRLKFLVDAKNEHLSKEMQVSMDAGKIVGRIYDALLKQYDDSSPEALRWLNILCVRIVFCLYAEDAEIFKHDQFHDFLVTYEAKDLRRALRDLFEVLNTPKEKRSRYLQAELAAFPYTNGGLFEEDIEIPQFTEELKETLLQNASMDFDWSEISPTIFGAVFESTLNPETRRSGGMHYTSIENIHKVIDPLFLNDLRAELDEILDEKVEKQRVRKLDAYQDKLASLTFLDPACGSGNFLTETYLSLRRLENEAIRSKYHDQIMIGAFMNPIKVSIHQFYGIEINDFAVTVATTALWISEAQMMAETEKIVTFEDNFLPLKSYSNIHEGNALRIEWESVVPKAHLNYIIGNPPFVGYSYQTKEQKEDLATICTESGKNIDYVSGWYYKAAKMIDGTNIHAALVSTNSITQGEQVTAIWKPLTEQYGVRIDFAHRTFRWDSEASLKAHVHCVIIGFSSIYCKKKRLFLFENGLQTEVETINPYLLNAPTVFIERAVNPICNVPQFVRGCQPTDDGNFILTDEECKELLKHEPQASSFIRPFMMGKDFILRKPRYCIWLKGANPALLHKCPQVLQRVEKVRNFRLKSSKAATRAKAETPTLFDEIREPESKYIGFPTVSSERRRYVPIDYLDKTIIPGNKIYFMQDASLYHFGIITSNVHMAWMRATCGRLEMRYNYSNTIVYNNFPWPNPTEEQKAKIEQTAQAILDASALYPDSSLADLYDELTMPVELRKAHQDNDRAVMAAYGFPIKSMTESQCVAELFKLYQELTNQKQ